MRCIPVADDEGSEKIDDGGAPGLAVGALPLSDSRHSYSRCSLPKRGTQMRQANLLTLLQVIGGPDIALDLKQIAAIYLKNAIKRQWYSGALDASLKPMMTSQLLILVPAVPAAVQDQLLECLRVSIQEHTSPDVVNQIVVWLESGNSGETVMAALKVMRIVARKYEYRDGGAFSSGRRRW